MHIATPYLNFDGTCREAMTFYQRCFGGELEAMTFGDGAEHFDSPPEVRDRMVHMRLHRGPFVLMASDTMPDMPFTVGNNVWLNLACESDAEVESIHSLLAEGGTSIMAPHDSFWGARFAMLTDRFGINWMLSHDRASRGQSRDGGAL